MTSSRPYLYVHVGLPKTATTALQRQAFPAFGSFDLAIKPRSTLLSRFGTVDPGIFRLVFNRSPLVWRSRGLELLRAVRSEEIPSRPLLVSDEGMGSLKCPFHLAAHFFELAKVAREAGYAAVRAIVVVRRQDQWLGSYYAQKSDRRRNASQADFEDFVAEWIDPARGLYAFEGASLDYAVIYEKLVETIGPDAVLPLLYEDLECEAANFVETLCSFLGDTGSSEEILGTLKGDRENARSGGQDQWKLRPPSLRSARFARKLNSVASSLSGAASKSCSTNPDYIRMPRPLRSNILSAYGRSNRSFAEISGLDLARYNYFE